MTDHIVDTRPAKRLKLSTSVDTFTISPESNSTAASSVNINPSSVGANHIDGTACPPSNPMGNSVARSEGDSSTDVPISPNEVNAANQHIVAANQVASTIKNSGGFNGAPGAEAFAALVNTNVNSNNNIGGNGGEEGHWDAMEIARSIPSPSELDIVRENPRLLNASQNRDKLLTGADFDSIMDPNTFACNILIEQQHVGQLMGAQGSGLQKIKSQCECPWLAIDQETRETGFSVVVIQEDNQKPAVCSVLSLLRGFFEDTRMKDALKMGASKEIRIEQQFIGGIIGRSGSAIEELKKEIGVEIVVDQSTKFEGYSRLTIYGQPQKITIANDELDRRVNEMREAARMRAQGIKGKGKGNMQKGPTDSWGMGSMTSSRDLGVMGNTGKGKGGLFVSDKPSNCRSIVIKNVPYNASEDDLKNHFTHCGQVINVHKLQRDGRFIGIVFVEFADSFSTDEAIKMNQTIYMGRQLCLDYATGAQERRGGTNRVGPGNMPMVGGKGTDSMSSWSGSNNTSSFGGNSQNFNNGNGNSAADALAALLGGGNNGNNGGNNGLAGLLNGSNNNNNNNNNNLLGALLGGNNNNGNNGYNNNNQHVTNDLLSGLLGNGNNNNNGFNRTNSNSSNGGFDQGLQALLGSGNSNSFDNNGFNKTQSNGDVLGDLLGGSGQQNNNNGGNQQYSDSDWNSWLNSVM